MVGPKLNDGAALLDGRGLSGAQVGTVITKASARYVRGSATKARAVLDLIRGLDVRRADEVLQFTERAAAADVRKVLASAVANAVHNDSQDADELFVVACYADEGPTLKRFRPRARGRASRINKRSCHITVVLARMSDERLEIVQARHAAGPGARRAGISAQARRERVARSRARAEGLRGGEADEVADTSAAADIEPAEALEDEVSELADEAPEFVSADAGEEPEIADTNVEAVEEGESEAVEVPTGAVVAPEDGSIPEGYPIKGNTNSMKYHEPGTRYYDITIAELFFDTAEHAEGAGYEAPAGTKNVQEEDE
jgi:large subunit ribosomal protein L22